MQLSWLEPEGLTHLTTHALLALTGGRYEAIDQDADHDRPNFAWFRDRHARFVDLDRIVVAAATRRRGLARRRHNVLFDHPSGAGHDRAFREVNANPPDPVSDAFHAGPGFEGIRSAVMDNDGKAVRYLSRGLVFAARANARGILEPN